MSEVKGRGGRKPFVPTPEQRINVKILASLGLPSVHFPGLGIAPGAELVAPCRIVLRTAQAFRLSSG